MLTMKSKIGELYANPIGHDVISKVLMQLGVSDKVITNPVIGNMKIETAAKLAKGKVSSDFFQMLLDLVNAEKDLPAKGDGPVTEKWWKEAVFYQIYPRSFCDTNGDGIGDLRGIIEKLDYLQNLGITALWLSPIYDSPNDDNGYDIRDYHKIMTEFGTMEDFDELLEKVHERGMRLIMDLVINHTSDEHEWFQKALADPESKYHDYYYFRKDDGTKTPPNNWGSFFAGPAWNYYEELDEWALHLFSKKQMDINWECDELRNEVIEMIKWWLAKGVDGFRMDVINYISKEPGLPNGDQMIADMMGYPGIEKFFYGPRLHEFLHEVREKAFDLYGAFSVGETPGIGMQMGKLITGEERKELDMIFSFDHLETPGHTRFDDYEYDLNYYRDYISDWMENYGNNCWMSLFYNNHDNPRMVSKVTNDKQYHTAIEKLLAVFQFTLKGTPFVFQGDEMGLTNFEFTSMDQVTDVEAKGYYQEYLEKMTPEDAFKKIVSGTREHTRIPLPWNETVQPCHAGLKQEVNEEVLAAYKELIALRKDNKALIYGDFEVLDKKKDRFTYRRKLNGDTFIIDCNLGKKKQKAYISRGLFEMVYGSEGVEDGVLRPYEARIWKKI